MLFFNETFFPYTNTTPPQKPSSSTPTFLPANLSQNQFSCFPTLSYAGTPSCLQDPLGSTSPPLVVQNVPATVRGHSPPDSNLGSLPVVISTDSMVDIEPPVQQEPISTHQVITWSKTNSLKPKKTPVDYICYPLPKALVPFQTSDNSEPTCYSEAIKSSEWRSAVNNEFDAHIWNQIWTLVPPVFDVNIIGCKWVYRIKRRADGQIERFKALLVQKVIINMKELIFMRLSAQL